MSSELIRSINMIVIGFIANLIIFLVLWAFSASILTNYFSSFLKKDTQVLFMIILFSYIVSIIADLIVSLILYDEYSKSVILYCFIVSGILNFIAFMFISVVSLLIVYPYLFDGLNLLDLLLNTDYFMSTFSIYMFDNPMWLIIIMIFTDNVLFTLILKLIL